MEDRFAVAYPIKLWPTRKEVMAIIGTYPTEEALERGYDKVLTRYNTEPEEHDGPPKRLKS